MRIIRRTPSALFLHQQPLVLPYPGGDLDPIGATQTQPYFANRHDHSSLQRQITALALSRAPGCPSLRTSNLTLTVTSRLLNSVGASDSPCSLCTILRDKRIDGSGSISVSLAVTGEGTR
ncbi:hypothetical protein ACSZM7_21250 [Aeromonas veronii]